MKAGEFDFYGETYLTLSGGTVPEHVENVVAALDRRGIRSVVDRAPIDVGAHQRVHIPVRAFDRIDNAFWDEVNGPREPACDPYSFRRMVREIHTSARCGVKNVVRAVPQIPRAQRRRR